MEQIRSNANNACDPAANRAVKFQRAITPRSLPFSMASSPPHFSPANVPANHYPNGSNQRSRSICSRDPEIESCHYQGQSDERVSGTVYRSRRERRPRRSGRTRQGSWITSRYRRTAHLSILSRHLDRIRFHLRLRLCSANQSHVG